MPSKHEHDYAMEYRLKELDPELHKRFTDSVFGLQSTLSNYKLIFPEYTDHTELHSLTVIDFCNRLIGDQLEHMNADELYALLMGCYFHDTGMGVSEKDFDEFSHQIDFGNYFDTHAGEERAETIRSFHNEFSGLFIRKYAPFFEIPSETHLRAIIQISRGHRKTNLLDESVYPIDLRVPNGNTICLPYLAALIRLADEIDVTSARDSALLYDVEGLKNAYSIEIHKRHQAVHELRISPTAFTLLVDTSDKEVDEAVCDMARKMQETLDDCRGAVNGRTPHIITQQHVRMLSI